MQDGSTHVSSASLSMTCGCGLCSLFEVFKVARSLWCLSELSNEKSRSLKMEHWLGKKLIERWKQSFEDS